MEICISVGCVAQVNLDDICISKKKCHPTLLAKALGFYRSRSKKSKYCYSCNIRTDHLHLVQHQIKVANEQICVHCQKFASSWLEKRRQEAVCPPPPPPPPTECMAQTTNPDKEWLEENCQEAFWPPPPPPPPTESMAQTKNPDKEWHTVYTFTECHTVSVSKKVTRHSMPDEATTPPPPPYPPPPTPSSTVTALKWDSRGSLNGPPASTIYSMPEEASTSALPSDPPPRKRIASTEYYWPYQRYQQRVVKEYYWLGGQTACNDGDVVNVIATKEPYSYVQHIGTLEAGGWVPSNILGAEIIRF